MGGLRGVFVVAVPVITITGAALLWLRGGRGELARLSGGLFWRWEWFEMRCAGLSALEGIVGAVAAT